MNFPLTLSGDGGAILFQDLGLFRLEQGLFQDNQALGLGGAIMLTDSVEMQLQNISVIGNLAAGGSAFTGLQHAKLRMINTLITYNVIYPGLSAPGKSIILADNINLEIYNTTIANNTAITGGSALYTTGTQAIIKNSIIWNNEPAGIVDTLSNLAVSYSDIGGGWSGTGNIDSDPMFNNASQGDYSLTAVSPCINTADPDTTGLLLPPTDLNGNPRIAQGLLDMGPLESFFPLISENISGHIVYGNPAHPTPLPNCTVKLQQGTLVIASTQTDNTGYYLFTEKPAGNYTLKVSSTNPWGGINSIDALLILKHFVGLNILQGLLLKVANVDNSANVNAIDAQLVGKRFVGLISSFPAGDWVFDIPQVTIPQSGALDIIIHGVCMGDVNASFIPSY